MAEAQVTDAGPELEGADVTDSVVPDSTDTEFESLFDGEAEISEAELTGEDTTADETDDAGPTGDETVTEQETEKAEEQEKEEDKPEETEDDPKEPDPIAKKAEGLQVALHQAREKIGEFKSAVDQRDAHIKQLNAQIIQLQTPQTDGDKFKDFKVLTRDEYVNLNADDPDKAAEYMYDLREYEKHQAVEWQRQAAERSKEESFKSLVNEGAQALEEVLPGLYKNANEDAPKITAYADERLNPVLTDLLTDPSSKITSADGKQFVLGKGAATIVKFLKDSYEASQNTPDIDKLRDEIKAELLPELEEQAQRTVMEKLKTDPNGGLRSLDQASTSTSKDTKPLRGFMTEAELAKLPESERDAYLGAG